MSQTISFKNNLKIKKVAQEVSDTSKDAMRLGAELILDKANQWVPHDTGKLESSGKITEGEAGEYGISYTGPQAIRLHEHPEYQFQNGRRGKWLEDAITQHSKDAITEVANEIREELR